MFDLTKHTATLSHLNTRTEVHGDRKRPAADLKLTIEGRNELLELIDSDLRPFLFAPKAAEKPDELFESDPDLTELKFPHLGPVHWTREVIGRDVVIEWGIDETSEIRLAGCDIDKFAVEPHDGGTVTITFRVRCYPSATDAGKLFELQQREVVISVLPPAQAPLALELSNTDEVPA